ncbi:ciliary microtubule inner protein 2B-like [Babylonia areolata]|uniref:ciliary microtubule inner protein 2B-like n=1 Tax=Babylonia areolata TaxID=304850 RepID=UPI003FD104CE
MPMPLRGKSILQTQDPYHTPGYGGFCPQFKYRIGETFGKTTNKLLGEESVASSGRLVLAQIFPDQDQAGRAEATRTVLLQSRDHSWGDQKLVETMVPGYTGFIPRSQHFFGYRYANVCRNSVSDFEFDQRKHQAKQQEMRLIETAQSGGAKGVDPNSLPPLNTKLVTPLKAVADKAAPFVSSSEPPPTVSPYYLANNDDNKKFMSGYTGFVPRSRGQLGLGYPIITSQALNEFTDDTSRQEEVAKQPVVVSQPPAATRDSKKIYPTESGLVPHYTGHIPVQKFRFGETFGNSTQDAMSKTLPPVS